MKKETIKYTDYNGVERTEDYYFNLSQAELLKMEMSISGGLTEMIQKIVETQDVPKIAEFFEDLVFKAYGEKSLDGKYFNKKDENGRPLAEKFAQTEAYSVLYMSLATDAKKASEFVNGIIPQDLQKKIPAKVAPSDN